ncbi:MAG: hypothetical protein ACJ79S_00565 [Gemmatimonadaceae bacterium]
MPDETRGALLDVIAWGIDRGAEFGGPASLVLGDTALSVTLDAAAGGRRHLFPYASIDGVRVEPAYGGGERAQLTIFLGHGDVAELTGPPALRGTARALENAACALTEQTLALRALGSPRARPGSDHDRFFGPLLAARRGAERAGCAVDRVASFDAPALRRTLTDTLRALAAERFPDTPPDRRALEAELRDLAEPLESALDRLAAAADAVRASGDDARFARWREWAGAVHDVFAAADAAWLAWLPALGDSRGRRGRLWRRLLRRGA